MSAQDDLIERLRALLVGPMTREVPMFGGRSFLVDDAIAVSALKDGALLVRVDPARHDELVARPAASPAEMGRGRTMGPSWIRVAPEGIADDAELAAWVRVALQRGSGGRR